MIPPYKTHAEFLEGLAIVSDFLQEQVCRAKFFAYIHDSNLKRLGLIKNPDYTPTSSVCPYILK